MSSRGGSSSNGGGVQSIPAASRKMVQSLKEIVNCPESEIYAMLKECNMDPNEAGNRLLSQDPFHEVKSKREKRKENKDTPESRSRGINNTSNRVGRGSSDRYTGRGGSTQFISSETGALPAKPAYKKENETHYYSSPSSVAYGMTGNNLNQRPPAQSDHVTSESKATTIGNDGTLSSSQLPSGYQAAWSGVPGQVSMADIVKMGRSHSKASGGANPSQYYGVNQHYVHTSRSSEDHVSKVSELNHEQVVSTGHHVSPDDDWPSIEQPPAICMPPVLEQPVASDPHVESSNFTADMIQQHPPSPKDEFRELEDDAFENTNNYGGSASAATQKMQEENENPSGDFHFSNGMYENMGSYQTEKTGFEHDKAEDVGASVSSVASNLQQLSVQEDRDAQPEEDNSPPPVIIPSHLQVQTADCSHLSFGSFGSGIGGSAFSRPFSSRPLQSNMEEASADANTSSVGHPDTRNSEYYIDEPLKAASDGNLVHRTGASGGSYDSPSSSQPELLKKENTEAPDENQYSFPSSTSSYNFENGQQSSSQMQNMVPFSSVMQAYSNTLPSSLLAASVQPVRESDLPYSPFPMTHTMPTKYGNAMSSISSSTISIPEALKTGGFSSTQPTAQTLNGSNIGTAPTLPQHLAMHPYSQPTVPLGGPFANMIGYPFLPQSYTYMPSAFQQAFAGNSAYHQSLAAVLPQYKNNVSVSNLPQSAAIASGYGGFGSSTSIPGNFSMNPPAASGPTTISYDDLMSSQYKDSNHLISLPQNENSPMWVHGPGSRTMSPVPSSTYYSFQGQSQQPPSSGYRQTQQPSQNYGGIGYPNFYHSQSGMSLEHQQLQQQQQQNARDVHLGGSQAQASKQSQQLWQNSY